MLLFRRQSSVLAILIALLGLAAVTVAAAQTPTVDTALRERLRTAMIEVDSFEDKFDAQVWLTDMAIRLGNQVKDPEERVDILMRVHQEAARIDLPAEMVLAVIDVESAFDAYAVSRAGALGLMQVMPFWLDEIGRPGDRLVDYKTNLRMGCTILRYYYDMENGDWVRALGRYNGSLGSRVYPEKVLNRLSERWFKH